MSNSDSESDTSGARKRARLSGTPPANGHSSNRSTAPRTDAHALPPLSLSILGVEPIDEFIREIADFIHHTIMNRPANLRGAVEVEAKIGVLKDRNSRQRLSLPVQVETIIAPDAIECRFESNMSAKQHQHFNALLNSLMMKPPPTSNSPIAYKHYHLIDTFYNDEDAPNREKIRVTRDERTGEVRECLRKIRLADLNIFSPKRAADWRVSVNMEVPVQHPLGSSTHSRKKDRMSYTHEEFVIDLTQVVTSRPNAPTEMAHELELEFVRSDLLLSAAARREDPSVPEPERAAFDELVRAFVNNVRILARNTLFESGWP